jgi:hypothetical protein
LLVESCGVYPEEAWKDLWQRNQSPVFRYYHPMQVLVPEYMKMLYRNSVAKLFKPEFFTQYHARYLKKDVLIVAPILKFPDGEVTPGFTIGTRGNCVDAPHWPEDLTIEVVE